MGLEYFTENNILVIQKKLSEDLEILGMKYGIDFNITKVNYSNVGIDISINGVLNNKESQEHIKNEQEKLVEQFCTDRGIENLYDKSYVLGDMHVTVIGVNTNRKDTLLVKDTDGRTLNVSYELLVK